MNKPMKYHLKALNANIEARCEECGSDKGFDKFENCKECGAENVPCCSCCFELIHDCKCPE